MRVLLLRRRPLLVEQRTYESAAGGCAQTGGAPAEAVDTEKSRAERAAARHRDYVTEMVASGKTQKQILEALHVKRFEDKAGQTVGGGGRGRARACPGGGAAG